MIVVALSVLREGAETVLFVAGYVTDSGTGGAAVGVLLGLLCGAATGWLIYQGPSRVPLQRMFAVTNTLILLLAAAIASQLAGALAQAGVLNAWDQPLWDSSGILRMGSALGTLALALVGYEAQPTGMQLTFYVVALAFILQGSRWVRQAQAARRTGEPQRVPSS